MSYIVRDAARERKRRSMSCGAAATFCVSRGSVVIVSVLKTIRARQPEPSSAFDNLTLSALADGWREIKWDRLGGSSFYRRKKAGVAKLAVGIYRARCGLAADGRAERRGCLFM
jgi:hypothetical protein